MDFNISKITLNNDYLACYGMNIWLAGAIDAQPSIPPMPPTPTLSPLPDPVRIYNNNG